MGIFGFSMKKTIEGVITKGEIKFWLSIIVMLSSVFYGFSNIRTDIALLTQSVDTLAKRTEEVNSKFSAVHTDNADQESRIVTLETLIGINK